MHRLHEFKRRHRGQILPVAMFALVLSCAGLVLMFNMGQKVSEKTQVANAADAAAYSAAVWTARHLNFMAYTNRAMIANHVAVGHVVSFMSWFNYAKHSTTELAAVTSWIPYIDVATSKMAQAVSETEDYFNNLSKAYIREVDFANRVYFRAQQEAGLSLTLGYIDDLMNQIATQYDPSIKINDQNLLSQLPGGFGRFVHGALNLQRVIQDLQIHSYNVINDGGRIRSLVAATVASNRSLKRWISGNRGWHFGIPFVIKIRKKGKTYQRVRRRGLDWIARDRFQTSAFNPAKGRWDGWITLASGKASATKLYSGYQGIYGYHNFSYRNPRKNRTFFLVAIAEKAGTDVTTRALLGFSEVGKPLAAMSVAEAYFDRPPACGSARARLIHDCVTGLPADRDEYSNLFNPFWQARLTSVPLPTGFYF